MAHAADPTEIRRDATAIPEIRTIGVADLREAVSRGIDDFLAAPTQLIFLSIIYPLVGLAAARVAVNGELMPIVYPLIAGLSLLGPITAIGLYEISRRREAGLKASWRDAFSVVNSPGIGGVVALGLVLLAIFVAWIFAAREVFAVVFGSVPRSPAAFMADLASPEVVQLVLVGHAVGFVFALAVLAITVVSFPLMLDRAVGVRVAVVTSVKAVLANPVTMAIWGVFVAFALAAGSLPLFVGLAVVMPVLGHATWHLYRRVVV